MPKSTNTDSSRDTAIPPGDRPPSFEAAIDELEKIVGRMESGELNLEDALAAHKRGLELAQYCQGVLASAQQQVRVLEQDTLRVLAEAAPDE